MRRAYYLRSFQKGDFVTEISAEIAIHALEPKLTLKRASATNEARPAIAITDRKIRVPGSELLDKKSSSQC